MVVVIEHLSPGDSGAGARPAARSTFLDFLCGTLDPAFEAEGRVLLDGMNITSLPPERRQLGILFQDALL
jgi:putative thiamine transport system ATP-binding protein